MTTKPEKTGKIKNNVHGLISFGISFIITKALILKRKQNIMTILLENDTNLDIGIEYEQIAKDVITAVLEYVSCPYECQVNILLTDNEGIRGMNKRMRDIDSVTDVLSFPMIPFEREADFSIVEKNIPAYFEAEYGELLLGDIMLSLEKVIEQAESYGHSIKREYAFLLAHSMLHLSGYDHMEDEERIRMEEAQNTILNGNGYTREL